jgi:hypothetical protein
MLVPEVLMKSIECCLNDSVDIRSGGNEPHNFRRIRLA